MATVINNPPGTGDGSGSGSSAGLIIGIIIAVILLFVLFAYGIPAMRHSGSGTNVNVPGKIDVNVNKGSGGTSGGTGY